LSPSNANLINVLAGKLTAAHWRMMRWAYPVP
jgi:hypothetical protein